MRQTEYLERGKILDYLNEICQKTTGDAYVADDYIRDEIRTMSADNNVSPVKRGRWVYAGGFAVCEHCGASPAYCEPKPRNERGYPPFCHECGAVMDMEGEDGV